ncbi:Rho termination factor [Pedococcus sp. KACC 23699]|uniref:Rho termination factor n=1 Tax=Pedococcus sp. KACC 23699 TaxID=3149228 RepID=A0AAU7JYG7_9MICO
MPTRKPGQSVKDPEMYEALREDGASKEKAARISNAAANTSRRAVGAKGGRSGDYEDWSKSDLLDRARKIGVRGRSSMSKAELIKALRDH